jgi:hypothetical protein
MAFQPKPLSAAIQLENQLYATTHDKIVCEVSRFSSRHVTEGLRIVATAGLANDPTGAAHEAMASVLIARGEAPRIADSTGKIWA